MPKNVLYLYCYFLFTYVDHCKFEDIQELSEIKFQPLPKRTKIGRKTQKCLFYPLFSREYSEHIEHFHKYTKESEELAKITARNLPKARKRVEKI